MPWITHSDAPLESRGQLAQTNDGNLFLVQKEEGGGDFEVYRWNSGTSSWDHRKTLTGNHSTSLVVCPRACAIGTTDKLLVVTDIDNAGASGVVNVTVYDDSAQSETEYDLTGDWIDSVGQPLALNVCPLPSSNKVMIVLCKDPATAGTSSGKWSWILWDLDTTSVVDSGTETGASTAQSSASAFKPYARAWIGVLDDAVEGEQIHIMLPMQEADKPCYWFDEDNGGAGVGAWVATTPTWDDYKYVEDDPNEFYDTCSAAFLDRVILPLIDNSGPWIAVPNDGTRTRGYDYPGDWQGYAWIGSVSAISGQVAYRLRRPTSAWEGGVDPAFVEVWNRQPWLSSYFAYEGASSSVVVNWGMQFAEGGVQTHYEVELRQGVTVVYDSGEVASAATQHVFSSVSVGSYTVYIRVKEGNGFWSEWHLTTVGVGGGGGGGSDPPTCSITTPSASAVVSGDVTVTADVTDDVGLDRATLSVDGVVIATDSTITGTSDVASFAWGSGEWNNGLHSLSVACYDTDGNFVSDAITVVTNNAFSDVERTLFTTCETLIEGHTIRRLWEAIRWDPESGDPFCDYSCRVYIRQTATDSPSTDLSDFSSVDAPGEQAHEPPPGSGEYFQWAIHAIPRLWRLVVELADSDSVIAFCLGPETDDVYILAGTAAGGADMQLFRYDTDGLTLVAALPLDLSALRGVAYVDDGIVYVARGVHLTAIDPDSGEVNVDLGVDPGALNTGVYAVARESATELLVATANVTSPRAYRYTYGSTEFLGAFDTSPFTGGIHATAAPSSAFSVGGKVYLVSDLVTPDYTATGQTETTVLCEGAPGEMILGTKGTVAGKLYSSSPSWALSLTLLDLEVAGVAYSMGALWAAGTSAEVWRRNPSSGSWASRIDLSSDLDDIDRLSPFAFDDGSEALLIGGTKDGDARMIVYREAPDDAGAILSGPIAPRFMGGIADSTKD